MPNVHGPLACWPYVLPFEDSLPLPCRAGHVRAIYLTQTCQHIGDPTHGSISLGNISTFYDILYGRTRLLSETTLLIKKKILWGKAADRGWCPVVHVEGGGELQQQQHLRNGAVCTAIGGPLPGTGNMGWEELVLDMRVGGVHAWLAVVTRLE